MRDNFYDLYLCEKVYSLEGSMKQVLYQRTERT
jgi:hypothetical protein